MRCGGSTWKKGLLITAFVLIVFTVGAINFNNFEIYKGLKEDLAFGRSSNANESLAATPSIWAIALGSNLTWKLTVTILNAKRFISSRVWLSIRSLHPINAFAHILHLCSALRLQILHSLQHTAASQLRDTNSTLVPSTAVVTGPYSHSSALSQTRFPSKLISLIKSPIPASETIQPLISTTLLLSPANSSPQKFKVPFSSPSPSTMGLSPSPPTFPAPVSSSLPPDQTPEGPSSSASPPKPETSAIPPYLSPPSISPLLFTPLLESPRKPSQHAFGDPFSPFPYPSLAPLKEGGMLAPPVAHSSDQILSPADVHPPPKEVRSSLNSPAFSKTESPSTSSSFPPALAPVLAPRRPPSFSFSSLASPGSFPPVLSSAPAIENGHATYSMSSPVLPSSQPLSPLQAPLSLSIPSLSSKPPDSSPFLSFASPSSSPSTVPPTFSPAHGLDDATMPPKQAMSSLSSPSSLINALAPQQATSAEASLKSPISQAVASVMAPTGVSSDSPQSSNIIIPFTQSPSPAPARKDVSTPSQLAKANSPPNSPGFLDVQAPRQQAPVSGFLHAQPSSPPFENSSPQQPSFSDSPIFSTPSLPLAPTVTPSSFPFSRSPLLAPASDFENSPIPQASFSLGSPPSQKPAAPDSGSPPLLANAPSFLHSTPPPEIAIESTSPTPLHAPSALHTPAFSSTSSPIVAEGPALQDSGSSPFQAPSISNAPNFLHSTPPPEIAIESTSPTSLHAPSSLPTPSNPLAISSPSSPQTVAQGPASQGSGSPPFQAPSISNAPSFLHSTPPPEIAIESKSPTPLQAPSSLPTPSSPQAFSSTSSPLTVAQGPASQGSGSPPFQAPSISNAPSFLHSMPSPEIAIESTSLTPLHAPSSLPTPSNPQAFSSTSSPPTVAQGPASQGSGSPPFQAPSISNAPSFLHSMPPPEIAIESTSPTPLHAPSSLPTPSNPQAFSSTSSPPTVMQGPASQGSGSFQAPSISSAPSFFHSTPPPEVATQSISPTPLHAPSSLPSPGNPQAFSSTSSPIVAEGPALQDSPVQAPSIINAPNFFHSTPPPELATKSTSPTPLETPSSLSSPSNPQTLSSTSSPTVAPASRQTSYPATSKNFPFPIHHTPSAAPRTNHIYPPSQQAPVYAASPNNFHSQAPSSAPKPLVVLAPLQASIHFLPPSPLLSSVSSPSTQPSSPASTVSMSPSLSVIEKHAPAPLQPPVMNPVPPPHTVPQPLLAPLPSMPQNPVHPPLLGRPSPLPSIVLSPVAAPGSPKFDRSSGPSSPLSLGRHAHSPPNVPPTLEASSPVLSRDTNNELAPASTSHHSMSPTTGLHSMPPETSNELAPASTSRSSMSPPTGLHSMPPEQLRKPLQPAPSVAPTAPVQVNSTASSHSSKADSGHHVPAMPPTMIYFPPPPNSECQQMCTDPYTSTPGSPCGCVIPMLVGLELSTTLYSLFPLVSELAQELAAGTFLSQSQVRIMGANTVSDNVDKTEVKADLVPLALSFDHRTALSIAQRFWSHQVFINETLFGNYSLLYIQYPGLPPSPPSRDSVGPDSGILNGGNQASIAQPLSVDIAKSHSRQPPAMIKPATGSSTTKRSGGGSVRSSSLGGSESMSSASGLTACSASSKTFTLAELENATKNFRPERVIGEGGFGRVYWGTLEDGTKVAVKVLTRDDQQGVREFAAEVEMLSRLHHRNLVKLLGICTEENVRCLVYELIPNGSVEFHLHGDYERPASLNWEVRLKIALGSARGLAYLHEDSIPRVIHRDFKSSNILLEDDFNPKVSDFGLAKAASEEMGGHVSTRVMGTFGYVAPEYAMTGHLLVKSDVYSYGVVLLELLSGRKPVDMSRPSGEENLVTWARPLLRSKEGLMKLVDPVLGDDFPLDNLVKVAAIASMCVHPEVSNRPFMGEVVQALKLVYNDSEASDGALSRNDSIGGESSLRNSDSKLSLGQVLRSNSMYLPDATSFITVDYDSGSLEDIRTPVSASGTLSNSGRFIRQSSGSFERHNSSGPLTTVRSNLAWYRIRHHGGGTLSEHGLGMQHADKHYTDIWP
ncbi:hypothetical protein O6H91_02G040700 [Diphasiastrum complanatum]|uniref:Uncharacterized protein n=1 Tax=Diphasiastrum complanatum TaxID=34168 RepID=A0ACC2EEN4_DIPCM|nr:hypothetical protein O6H91_02G040700 [Diphasiastrum complanatum]